MKTKVEIIKFFTCRDRAKKVATEYNTLVIDTPDYYPESAVYPYMVITYDYTT